MSTKSLTNGRQWRVGERECRLEVADACLDVVNPFFTILRKFHSLKIHEISQYAQLYAQELVPSSVSLGPPFCHTRYKKVCSFIQLILTRRQRWDSFTSLVTFSHLQLSDGSDEQGLQSHPFVVCSQVSSYTYFYRLLLILQPGRAFGN